VAPAIAPAGTGPAAAVTLTLRPLGESPLASSVSAADAEPDAAPLAPAPPLVTSGGSGGIDRAAHGAQLAAAADGPESIVAGPPGAAAPPAPAQAPSHPAPAAGAPPEAAARSAAPAATADELAGELGARIRMAVRESGRELVVSLRPAELGQLTIRVTVHDGVLQAQILADRPEAARLLQQSLSQLDASLADHGYSLEDLEVAYGAPKDDERASSPEQGPGGRGRDPVSGEVLEADGAPALPGPSDTPRGLAHAGRLDLLA
jgi:hypothetical protein